ncbi:microfibril-associated glycoprotein 4-like [Oculina patagonica]
MASPRSLWSLIFVFLVLFAVSNTIVKTASSDNLSQVSPSQKAGCHNMYTYNNFYSGSDKKIEILLPEVKKELTQIREEIKSLKENETIATGPTKKVEVLFQEVKKELGEMREEIKSLKENKTITTGPKKTIRGLLFEIKEELSKMDNYIRRMNKVYRNCAELYKDGIKTSGVYTINPDNAGAFNVFCDQTTAGGGWTVFQKRRDGLVDFYRGWDDYKRGFGNLNGEFWLGLDKIHRLTKEKSRLRVELEDFNGKTAYAEYSFFGVASEGSKYKLNIGTYSGTAGDSLTNHRGYAFSTKDRDNDVGSVNCAQRCKGAWWYSNCVASNLNGLYHHGKHSTQWEGVNWFKWKGKYYSAKRAEMKLKPAKI